MVIGIVLNIFALGLTTFALKPVFGPSAAASPSTLASVPIPFLSDIPLLGPALSDQNVMVYAAFLTVVGVWWFLTHTDSRAGAAGMVRHPLLPPPCLVGMRRPL